MLKMTSNRKRALTFLWLGTLLFALGPAILKLLTTMGGRFSIANPGAISFCNVLFVGNFCAGLVTLFVYGVRRIFGELFHLSRTTKWALVLGAVASTVYPALIFTALERTSVINIVLLSRFNGIVFVSLAYVLFRTKVRRADVVGYGIIAVGVVVLVVINNGGFRLQSGEVLVLISTVFFALTEFISKVVLRECSIESYVFVRNSCSAAIFFVIAIYLFGFHHFMDAFVGELWILMVVYAGFAVVGAQLSWLKATRVLSVKTVAGSQLLNPAFSIFFAYLLLHEVPTALESMIMVVVAIGMLVPKLHLWDRDTSAASASMLGTGLVGTH